MAEGKCFHLEVVTPDRQFYIGDADSLVLPAIDGYMGVEAGHEPVVTAVVPGETGSGRRAPRSGPRSVCARS